MEHAGAAFEPTPRLRSSTSLAALTLFALLARQGWLPAIFDERVVPLTGLKAPLPSFPFVDPNYALQPPPGVMRQFVMVLVARFRMSVAEIIVAYALVGPHHTTTTTPPRAPTTRSPCPSPKDPLSTQRTRLSEHFCSTQPCYMATRSARSSWGAAHWRSR